MNTTASTSAIYTAAELASAVNRTAPAIRQSLVNIRPASCKIIAGNPADAWRFLDLPLPLREELQAAALAKGYRNAEHLLRDPNALWQSPVPIAQRPQPAVQKAIQLRAALVPFLETRDASVISQGETQAAIAAAYQKEIGHPITLQDAWKVFQRTIERDRQNHDWKRLEIYLDDPPGRTSSKPKSIPRTEFDFSALADTIDSLENPAALTASDREFLFDSFFRCYETTTAQNPGNPRTVRHALLRHTLSSVPAISKSLESLDRTFKTKYAQWQNGGKCPAALSDQRAVASGNYRRPNFPVDAQKIRDTAILHTGSESLAHRILRQRDQLSPEFCQRYPFDPRKDKSRIPATLRQQITPEVNMCGPIHLGPHEARMCGPYIQRDWSGVRPGEWFSADDVTWNSYFWHRDDDDQLQITRGECLLFIDLRTGYPLDFKLIAGKYNGEHIRSTILRVHDLHGLPEKGFYFERGVWKSRLITGETNKALVHWRDSERGLRDYGLDMQMRHARTPRAKTIEGLFRILQERQRSEIGFAGFNERLEKMERVQDIIGRCKRGTEDPRNHFLSMEQWGGRISQCFTEYLADPQNGKMLDGATPAEMWAQRQPLKKLPDDARYVLATHRVRVKVRQEGIILTMRGKRLAFYNEHTGSMIGRDVFAYYNIEQPDLLTVSDLNRENFFTVKNHTLPAMSATREQFAAVNKDRAGHMRRAKEIYGNIQHTERKFIVRDNSVDEESKSLGRFHNDQVQRFQQDQAAATDSRRRRVARGLELLAQTGPEISTDAPASPKVYILDPSPGAKPSASLYWALWAKVEKIKPGVGRHALTQKIIGCHPKPQEMTPDQLSKMIGVFSAIIRDAKSALTA
ncbi:MAG TPA: hypothetical protein VHZ30_03110 [Verrucomicrobiae bacterium]|nr:hypothetical protein [Verrucomicrobiae bacterium]